MESLRTLNMSHMWSGKKTPLCFHTLAATLLTMWFRFGVSTTAPLVINSAAATSLLITVERTRGVRRGLVVKKKTTNRFSLFSLTAV